MTNPGALLLDMATASIRQLVSTVVFALVLQPLTGVASESERALYREVEAQIEKRQFDGIQDKLFALREYPLHSYLEADLLAARLERISPQTIEIFLENHRGQVVQEKLLRPWLSHLARQKDWDQFLKHYSPELANNELRCYRIQALQHQGRLPEAQQEIATLWQTGYSLPKKCDPIIEVWIDEHPQREHLIWQRSRLALDSGQLQLAAYLLKQIPVDREIRALLRKPQALADIGLSLPVNSDMRTLVYHSLRLLIRRNHELAESLWDSLHERYNFTEEQQFAVRRHIGQYLIANDAPETPLWLAQRDPDGQDQYLLEWRIKLALKQESWEQAQSLISLLSPEVKDKPQWQYWLARVRITLQGHDEKWAQSTLTQLSQERGYYGFLAADLLDRPYNLRSREQRFPGLKTQLLKSPDIVRARELQAVDAHYWANREWRRASQDRSPQELASMAELAQSWGWYHQGILTAIRAGHWDDLNLRFPLAFANSFSDTATQQGLELNWLYAIARKESAFSSRAISPVGARGVMQIMPATARDLARDLNWKYRKSMLFELDKNISMGGYYLGQLLDQFNGNRILATAAYNAGPAAISKILDRQQKTVPFDLWVETLPLSETRDYIKGVLAFAIVYSKQLGAEHSLVANNERFIEPSATLTAANESVSDGLNPVQ